MKYVVKKGDTLSGIAKAHNTTVEALVASNGIKDKNLIFVGQVLEIPEPANGVRGALLKCLDAIEKLPEYKALEALLEVK